MKINNRRYLGNKFKLLPFIQDIINSECKNIKSVFDVFAGTGAVASAFLDKEIIVNDILYSNYLAHLTWFSPDKIDKTKLNEIITNYNNISDVVEDNYMSLNFANTYFSYETCKKIGYIRDDIEDKYRCNEINTRERAILVTTLIYALDKIANTCGHYDAYRKGAAFNDNFILELPEIDYTVSKKNKCYNMDSNQLAKEVKCDLAYLDPPYNSRQYCDAYHLLENIAKWEKPNVVGVAKKMDRTNLKSDYCTVKATKALEQLVENLNCKYIMLSYNNTADTANGRSNAKIKDEDIIRILSKKGLVKVFSTSYKAFTTGKSENDKNEERIFLCIVSDKKIASPLNYTGGKTKLLPQIEPLFPEHIETFVDLFCGGCNVGINIPANYHRYYDKQEDLIGLYKTFLELKEEELFEKIEGVIYKYNLSDTTQNSYEYYGCNSSDGLAKYNKDKYIKLRDDFNKLLEKDEEYYIMFFVLIIYAFNNQIRFNRNNEFNLPVGKRDFNIKLKEKLSKFLMTLKLQNPLIQSCDFETFNYDDLGHNDLVYCDPPYLISTASYNEQDGWTENDERRLLQLLDELDERGIKFALSNVITHKGKTNYILKEWLDSRRYHIHRLNYNYNNSNYHIKDNSKETQEVLITNYIRRRRL